MNFRLGEIERFCNQLDRCLGHIAEFRLQAMQHGQKWTFQGDKIFHHGRDLFGRGLSVAYGMRVLPYISRRITPLSLI